MPIPAPVRSRAGRSDGGYGPGVAGSRRRGFLAAFAAAPVVGDDGVAAAGAELSAVIVLLSDIGTVVTLMLRRPDCCL